MYQPNDNQQAFNSTGFQPVPQQEPQFNSTGFQPVPQQQGQYQPPPQQGQPQFNNQGFQPQQPQGQPTPQQTSQYSAPPSTDGWQPAAYVPPPIPKVSVAKDKGVSLHICCLILTIVVIGCIVFAGAAQRVSVGFRLIVLGFWMIVYYIECCRASTGKYLANEFEDATFDNLLARIKQEKPTLQIMINCYHMEIIHDRTTYRDANGNTQTRVTTRTEKRITYTETQSFHFNDYSDDTGEIMGMVSDKIMKLKINKFFTFADPITANRFAWQRANLILMNRFRDDSIEDFVLFNIPFHKGEVMVKNEGVEKPKCLSTPFYILFSFFLMSWPYRLWTEKVTDHKEITVIKRIGRDPALGPPTDVIPVQIVPVVQMPGISVGIRI
jgi:hypothetical protein